MGRNRQAVPKISPAGKSGRESYCPASRGSARGSRPSWATGPRKDDVTPEEHRKAAGDLGRKYGEAMVRAVEFSGPVHSGAAYAQRMLLFYEAADCCAGQAAIADRIIREAKSS